MMNKFVTHPQREELYSTYHRLVGETYQNSSNASGSSRVSTLYSAGSVAREDESGFSMTFKESSTCQIFPILELPELRHTRQTQTDKTCGRVVHYQLPDGSSQSGATYLTWMVVMVEHIISRGGMYSMGFVTEIEASTNEFLQFSLRHRGKTRLYGRKLYTYKFIRSTLCKDREVKRQSVVEGRKFRTPGESSQSYLGVAN